MSVNERDIDRDGGDSRRAEIDRQREGYERRRRLGRWLPPAICLLILLLGIVYLTSLTFREDGSFTVKVGDGETRGALALSETVGFANPTVSLSGIPMDHMGDTTYDRLPLGELDTLPGSHNGDDYIAYTFYVRNGGSDDLSYTVSYDIVRSAGGVDGAVRLMIFRDGEPSVYALEASDGGCESVPAGLINFESARRVAADGARQLRPGQVSRYTLVIWLEGTDPQCTDAILKGSMQLEIRLEELG